MKFLTFLLSILVPILASHAQNNAGSAEYAMLSSGWPCALARQSENQLGLKVLRKAVLWNTFGTNTSCLQEYLADTRLVSFQLHLINEVCQRHNNCGDYEFLYGMKPREYNKKLLAKDPILTAKLTQYMKEPSELINLKLQPQTECLISPGLESNISKGAMQNLIDIVKPLFPKCKIVWNPVINNPDASPLPDTVFESHGDKPSLKPPCNADLDGVDISFPTRPAILPQFIPSNQVPLFVSRFKACENSFLWIAEYNGIAAGPFIDPRKRRAFPTLETFNLVNGLLR